MDLKLLSEPEISISFSFLVLGSGVELGWGHVLDERMEAGYEDVVMDMDMDT